jgi:hypothetical protein
MTTRTPKTRCTPILALVAVLAVIVVASCLWFSKMQHRQEFVARGVAASGLRCRYTASSSWKRDNEMSGPAAGDGNDVFTFQQSPTRQWIDRHLLHRTSSDRMMISVSSGITESSESSFDLVAGYPELPEWGDVTTHRHLQVDGYAATLLTKDISSVRITGLFIYIPKRGIVYIIDGGVRPATSDFASFDHELQAIIGSVHIERDIVATGGKR